MKIKVFKLNENGKVEISLEELQALIDEAAEENKTKVDNRNSSFYYPNTISGTPVSYQPNAITCCTDMAQTNSKR